MIIAFGHRKQMGKDTAAHAIQGANIGHTALADPLYRICEKVIPGFDTKKFYDENPKWKDIPLLMGYTPRDYLISMGQSIKAEFGKDCWVNAAVKDISWKDDLIISDLRYKEEAEFLKKKGAVTVKVIRPGVKITHDEADDDLEGWNGWDHVLVNNVPLEDFKKKAIRLYEKIRGI